MNESDSARGGERLPLRIARRIAAAFGAGGRRVVHYVRDNDPTFGGAFAPALIVAAVLFVRSPLSNYIFDEQEALLANPYVNAQKLGFWAAFTRDFWGLPPERSIGSYRPIPNLIWRLLWHVSEAPWLHHWLNVVVHAANAALVSSIALSIGGERRIGWFAGACFVTSAVLTEAVTGVVGIADVLCGLGVLLALSALRLPLRLMPAAVFASVAFGLFCKESAIVSLPLLGWAALVSAPALHERPLRGLRALLATSAAFSALVFYTYLRRHYFPVPVPEDAPLALEHGQIVERALRAFLHWFKQPRLPQDPINNPLAETDFPHRVAGALRVYWHGLEQMILPLKLSGDYSYRQEPVPARLIFPESVAGAMALILPIVLGLTAWFYALGYERRSRRVASVVEVHSGELRHAALVAIGLCWLPIAYFPHSNIPIVLPTVRAERFWYLPVIGAAFVLAVLFSRLNAAQPAPSLVRMPFRRRFGHALTLGFFGFQCFQARRHALDYADDLAFWRATRESSPNSAKAHLNYSVMLGARGKLNERLAISKRALELAPQWPMAHVYYADALCRLHRAERAFPHYVRGFELAPNDPNLIALGLQCLWDEKAVDRHREELLDLAQKYPGSWLAYLGTEIVNNGAKHGGVEKKYRPRGYDEGPKSE